MKDYIIDCSTDASLIINVIDYDNFNDIAILKYDTQIWLNENCNGKWDYRGIVTLHGESNEGIKFTFDEELDIMGFKLRWA